MTRVLVLAVIIAQLLDVATWSLLPAGAERNLLVAHLHTTTGWLLKAALVVLVLAVQPALRPKYAEVGEAVALLAVAVGCVGAGANLSVLVAS